MSSVIDVTLPHTPLPMVGKRYSGLRCFLLRGWRLTGIVGGILGVYIQARLATSSPRDAVSQRRVSVCSGVCSVSAAPSRLTVRLSGRFRNEARDSAS